MQRLRLSRIDRVAFVDKGDNPEADVVVHKRAPDARTDEDGPGWLGRLTLRIAKALGMDEETARAKLHAMGAVDFEDVEAERRLPAVHEEIEAKLMSVGAALHRTLEADEDGKAETMADAALQFAAAVEDAAPRWAAGETVEKDADDGDSHEDETMSETTETGFDLDALPDEHRDAVQKHVEALEKRAEDAEAKAADAGGGGEPDGIEALEKRIETLEAAGDDETASLVKATLAEAKRTRERAEATESRLEKLEGERRRERLIAKAQTLADLPSFNPDDDWEVLAALEDALDEAQYARVEKALRGAAEATRTGGLFDEIGVGGEAPEGTVEAEVRAATEDVRKAHPDLSEAQARARVWKDRPDLYDRYERERSARTRDRQGG